MRRFFLADGGADFPGNVLDVAEVELAIFQAGRSDADERDFGIKHGCRGVGGRVQQAGAARFGDHFTHARFDDRGPAGMHHLNFGAAYVDAYDFVAHGGKAGGRYGPDISQPKNANGQAQAHSPGNRASGGCSVAL